MVVIFPLVVSKSVILENILSLTEEWSVTLVGCKT